MLIFRKILRKWQMNDPYIFEEILLSIFIPVFAKSVSTWCFNIVIRWFIRSLVSPAVVNLPR